MYMLRTQRSPEPLRDYCGSKGQFCVCNKLQELHSAWHKGPALLRYPGTSCAGNKAILNLGFRRSGLDNALLYIHSNETTNTSKIFQSPCSHKIGCFLFPPCQSFGGEGNLCALGSVAVDALGYSSTCVVAGCLQSPFINVRMH